MENPITTQKSKILVVDDEPELLDINSQILQADGYIHHPLYLGWLKRR